MIIIFTIVLIFVIYIIKVYINYKMWAIINKNTENIIKLE